MGEMIYALMAQSLTRPSAPLDKVYGSRPSSSRPAAIRPNTDRQSPTYGYSGSADSDTDSDSDISNTSTLLLSHTSTTDDLALSPVSSLSPSLSLSSSTSSSTSSPTSTPKEQPFPFMRLPLEVRLQIYHWTLGMKSAPRVAPENAVPSASTYRHAADASAAQAAAVALSMSASSALFYNCIPMYFGNNQWGGVAMGVFSSTIQQLPVEYKRVGRGEDEQSEDKQEGERSADNKTDKKNKKNKKTKDILPSHRPIGKSIPTSLLLASRQIYNESCRIGYEESEFVFVRIFSAALSTAAPFVGLTLSSAWQRAAVRHLRIELDVSEGDMGIPVEDKDSKNDRAILEASKWTALCASLTGLRSLRLLLNVTEASAARGPLPTGKDVLQESPLLDGLLLLKNIRQIEIELVWTRRGRFASREDGMDAADVAANLAWCAALQERLQAVSRAKVVNAEQV